MITIFEKRYDGESLYDLNRDISESTQSIFNPILETLPKDEYNFIQGEFRVKIEWVSEEESAA